MPVQPAIMLLGGAATLLQMLANALKNILYLDYLIGALAQVMAWAAYVALQYTILVVQATAAIPFGSFEVNNVGAPFVMVFYLALALLTRFGIRRVTGVFLSRVWVMIALLALITMFVWTTALASPDPRTRITFVSAAEGDATFIRTPRDERILINGTAEPGVVLSFIGTQLPPWDRRIDVVIATHLDDDNLASLNAVLERYTVGKIVEPFPSGRPGVSYAKWRELIDQQQIAVTAAEQGTTLRVSDLEIEVLYPDAETDSSNVALRVVTNGQNILLAPTLRKSDRENILAGGAQLDADVAILPNEIETEWLERISPDTVILFVGKNPRDKPGAEILKLLGGMTVLRTDERGNIELLFDAEQIKIQAQK